MLGYYCSYRLMNNFLLESHLFIAASKAEDVLLVDEILSLYIVKKPDALRNMTKNFKEIHYRSMSQILSETETNEVETISSSGVALLSIEIGALMLAPNEQRGIPSIFNFESIILDNEDHVLGLKGSRNVGWGTHEPNGFLLPETISLDTPPRTIIRTIGKDMNFIKQPLGKKSVKCSFVKYEEKVYPEDKILNFFTTGYYMKQNTDLEKQYNKLGTSDEKLLFSLEWSRLDLFIKALEQGANSNMFPPHSTDPIIFSLAKNFKDDWIRVLIKIGKCSMMEHDANGFNPSYYPALQARKIADSSPDHPLISKLMDLSNSMQKEENRQMKAENKEYKLYSLD